MSKPYWSGVSPAITFPTENQYFWELTRRGAWEKAREIYRWFTPLLHLEVSTKFVQYPKLASRKPASARNTSVPRASCWPARSAGAS